MALIQRKITVPANSVSENVFSGTEYEFLAAAAKLTVSCIAESSADGSLRWTVGSLVLIDKAYMKQGTDFPIIPDNIMDAETIPAGQRNILTLENENAASKSFWIRIDIDYL